jgi:hypothetical protein
VTVAIAADRERLAPLPEVVGDLLSDSVELDTRGSV